MKVDLTGKKAIVTGGANGIGLACAQTLAAAGAEVWIFDLERENPRVVAAGFGANGHPADVTNRASLEAAFEAAGAPDIVIANAGTAALAGLTETSVSEWQRVIDVNLSGVFHTMQIGATMMKPRGGGSIVITASTNSFDGEPDLSAYNASKAGVLGLLRTAAGELGPHGIRVNAVCPGLIRTRLNDEFADPGGLKDYFRHIPLGCYGTPAEVANTVVFLASDLASYVTGATLMVDGGQMATKFGTWDEDTAVFTDDRWTLKTD